MRARHRLVELLLRHEVRFDGPQANWTQAHPGWLAGDRLEQPASQRAVADYRGAVLALMISCEQLEAEIAKALPESPWAQTARRLMCLRGIDTLTAAGLSAEIGDFTWFRHPAQVTSHLGVVPSEHSSGDKRGLRSPVAQCPGRSNAEGAWCPCATTRPAQPTHSAAATARAASAAAARHRHERAPSKPSIGDNRPARQPRRPIVGALARIQDPPVAGLIKPPRSASEACCHRCHHRCAVAGETAL